MIMGCHIMRNPALAVPELSLGVWNHLSAQDHHKGVYLTQDNMTLFNFDDDQMVPQVTLAVQLDFDHLSPAGSVQEEAVDCLNTPTLIKPIPDFECLLTGLTEEDCPASWTTDPESLSSSDFHMYPMADTADAYRALGGEPVHEQDLTFYDDTPMVSIKQEKYSPQEDYSLQQHQQQLQQQLQEQQQLQGAAPQSGGHHLLPLEVQEPTRKNQHLPDESQNDIDAVTKEIDGVCLHLNIPVSPYQWTVEQVTKWASWTLDQFNLPGWYLSDLKIDGTALCLLSAKDFERRWPHCGEYLYAQLAVWKGAYYNIKPEASPTEMYDEPPTYLNLEPASNSTHNQMSAQHHQQHHQQQQQQQQHHQQQQQQHHHHQQQQHHHQQQQHHHQVAQHQQPQPAYIPMTQSSTSPTPSPCGQAMYGSEMMLSSLNSIPKPVLTGNLICGSNLSPASSLDSMDSFASSPASETEFDRSFGGASLQSEPRPEVTPSKQNIHLWQFLRELLIQQHNYGSAIRWLDRAKGIFKIEDSARVARLWGQRKNRPAMNYDKLSRSIRQYYKKGIIKKTDNSKRLVYQFCPQYRV